MSDLRDTTSIPDTPEHWDAVASRVTARAVRRSRVGGLQWLSESPVAWLAAAVLIAAAVLLIVTLPARRPLQGPDAAWERMLAPGDDVGRAMAAPVDPPAIGTLLFPARRGA